MNIFWPNSCFISQPHEFSGVNIEQKVVRAIWLIKTWGLGLCLQNMFYLFTHSSHRLEPCKLETHKFTEMNIFVFSHVNLNWILSLFFQMPNI